MTETIALGSLIRPAGHRANGDTHLPVYSVTKHKGFVPSLEYFKKQVFAKDLSSYKVVAPGEFAFATIHLDEGSIGICPEPALISPMYTVFSSDDSLVDPGFLIRYLKSPNALAQYASLGRGPAERRKSISLEALGRVRLPLPPLPEQRRIAAILDHVDDMVGRRTSMLAALAMTRRVVTEKFFRSVSGEPNSLDPLILRTQNGIYVPAADYGSGTPILRIADFAGGDQIDRPNLQRVRISPIDTARFALRANDILINRVNAMSHVGKTALIGELVEPTVFESNMMRIEVDQRRIAPRYLSTWLSTDAARSQVQGAAKQAINQASINQEDVRQLRLPLAPVEAQKRFVATIDEIDHLATSAAVHLKKLHELFASLQYRAFRREL